MDQMSKTPTLSDDLRYAHEEEMIHLWGATLSAFASLMIPLFGLVAIYSGYRVSRVMTHQWVGYLFVGLGLFSLAFAFIYALFVL